jgi:hypothetical protein
MPSSIPINRDRVLTLWAAVVAQRLGYRWDKALSLAFSFSRSFSRFA